MKLTQSQRAVLATACEHELGLATPPSGRTAGQANKMASALIEKGLVKEIRAKADAPVWRKDEQGRDYALKILKAGRAAISFQEGADGPSKSDTSDLFSEAEAPQTPTRKATARRSAHKEGASISKEAPSASPRAGTKQALVIAMLREPGGVTLEALFAATGWLPHTTRAALTGLRKKGFEVHLERQDGAPSIYRITKEPASVAA